MPKEPVRSPLCDLPRRAHVCRVSISPLRNEPAISKLALARLAALDLSADLALFAGRFGEPADVRMAVLEAALDRDCSTTGKPDVLEGDGPLRAVAWQEEVHARKRSAPGAPRVARTKDSHDRLECLSSPFVSVRQSNRVSGHATTALEIAINVHHRLRHRDRGMAAANPRCIANPSGAAAAIKGVRKYRRISLRMSGTLDRPDDLPCSVTMQRVAEKICCSRAQSSVVAVVLWLRARALWAVSCAQASQAANVGLSHASRHAAPCSDADFACRARLFFLGQQEAR